jgi:hypothetical protein
MLPPRSLLHDVIFYSGILLDNFILYNLCDFAIAVISADSFYYILAKNIFFHLQPQISFFFIQTSNNILRENT